MRATGTALLSCVAFMMAACADQRSAPATIRFSAMQIHNCLPNYPSDAHAAGYGGIAVVTFTANPDGTTRDVVLAQSSGHPSIDQISLQIVNQCNVAEAHQVMPGGPHMVEYRFLPPNHIQVQWPGPDA